MKVFSDVMVLIRNQKNIKQWNTASNFCLPIRQKWSTQIQDQQISLFIPDHTLSHPPPSINHMVYQVVVQLKRRIHLNEPPTLKISASKQNMLSYKRYTTLVFVFLGYPLCTCGNLGEGTENMVGKTHKLGTS